MGNGRDRVALVTGASGGIGLACAKALAAQSFEVYGTSRRQGVTAEGISFVRMDVDDTSSVVAGIASILQRNGCIDVLVNNAGFGYGGSVEDTSVEEAKAQFETNVFGVLRVCQAVLPSMRRQASGLIVNVSSIAGMVGLPFQGLYSASKHAVEGMTQSLRLEVRRFGIDVVLLEPGDVNTPFTDNRRHTAASQTNEAYRSAYAQALSRIEEDERSGSSATAVGKALIRIVRARSPRPRYVVGRPYEVLAVVASKLLPGRLFERILRLRYRL